MAPVKELALRLRFGGFQFSHVKASFLEPKDTSTLLLSLWRKASPFSGKNQRLKSWYLSSALTSELRATRRYLPHTKPTNSIPRHAAELLQVDLERAEVCQSQKADVTRLDKKPERRPMYNIPSAR